VRILLVSEIFPPEHGGSGRWFWEIYSRLSRESIFIAAGQHPDEESFDNGHDLPLERIPLTMNAWGIRSFEGLRGYWRGFRNIRRLVRRERITILHAARCLPEGVMAWTIKRRLGVPFICYVHGEDVNSASHSRELSWLTRRVLDSAEYVVANSRNTADILHQEWNLNQTRVRVMHPGMDGDRFVPAAHSPETRQRLGWQGRTVVLTVGRLQKRKGQDHMILALPSIRAHIPNILYAIVGDGEERSALKELAVQQGVMAHVRFLGELRDRELVECYQQCDLFALPNREVDRDIEGFGMVLVEAQACGKAVLAGASGGTAETLRQNETGRCIPCDDPQVLAGNVVELLRDRASLERMGTAARAWAVERFDWANLVREAAELFGVHQSVSKPGRELAACS